MWTHTVHTDDPKQVTTNRALGRSVLEASRGICSGPSSRKLPRARSVVTPLIVFAVGFAIAGEASICVAGGLTFEERVQATDDWSPTSTGANVPSGRYYHTAADAWALPDEVSELRLTDEPGPGGWTTLSWSAPAGLGGLVVTYHVIRSSSPFGFWNPSLSSCVEANDADLEAVDVVSPRPGRIVYFLVVAGNACGQGRLGVASDGRSRTARDCP